MSAWGQHITCCVSSTPCKGLYVCVQWFLVRLSDVSPLGGSYVNVFIKLQSGSGDLE